MIKDTFDSILNGNCMIKNIVVAKAVPIPKTYVYEKGSKMHDRLFYILDGCFFITEKGQDQIVATKGSLIFLPADTDYVSSWMIESNNKYISLNFSMYNNCNEDIHLYDKIEKLAEPNGKYTIDDGKKLENISTINMDGFALNSDIDSSTIGGWTMWKGAKTATGTSGDRTVYLETTTYAFYKDVLDKSTYKIHSGTKIGSLSDAQLVNKPTAVGSNYFNLSRFYSQKTNEKGPVSPDASINLVNIFDEADVQVGDKVRVTAYVWPADVYKISNMSIEEAGTVTDTTFSLWVAEDTSIGPKEINYNKHSVENAKEGEYITTTVKRDQWNEVVLEYTITEENKTVSSIQMNSDNATHNVEYYPLTFTLGAVKVEKYVDDETAVAGKITGTVAVAPAAVEAGADYRVLVGAYNVVDGEYMMLGCNILPYEADSTYNFAIDNADGATEVKAYLWDFNSFEPQIVPIECTYIAQ